MQLMDFVNLEVSLYNQGIWDKGRYNFVFAVWDRFVFVVERTVLTEILLLEI